MDESRKQIQAQTQDAQRYRAVFSQLHSSIREEELIMKLEQTEAKARKSAGKRRMKAALLAAALAAALGISAAAVYRNRVQDLVLRPAPGPEAAETAEAVETAETAETAYPTEVAPVPAEAEAGAEAIPEAAPETEKSVSYDPMPGDADIISLQGFAGSPEYQAMLEWSEFQHGYDRDGAILRQVGNKPTPWDEKYNYNGYLVYSQEMADKLDAIAEKYGLALHTGFRLGATVEELREWLGPFTVAGQWGGYYYDDGTFQMDGEQEVSGYGALSFQLRRCMKGVLDTVSLNITDTATYEQWEYKTACGETVLLALGPHKALILADLPDSFVAVNVMAGAEPMEYQGGLSPLGGPGVPPLEAEAAEFQGPLSPASLEALADSIDFTLL